MQMVYSIFTYLLISAYTCLVYPSWTDINVSAEAGDTLRHVIKHDITGDQRVVEAGGFFAYQLNENTDSGFTLLLHLKEPVSRLDIMVYDPMGKSHCVMHRKNLERGFYYLPLPQHTHKQLHYWELKFGSKRALSFIR